MASLYQSSNQPTLWDIAQRTLVSAAVSHGAGKLFGDVTQREALAISDQKMQASNMIAGQAMAVSAMGSTMERVPELTNLFKLDPEKGLIALSDMISDLKEFELGTYDWTDSTMKNAQGDFIERTGQNKNVARAANAALDNLREMEPRLIATGELVTGYRDTMEEFGKEKEFIQHGDFARQGELLKLVKELELNAIKRSEIGLPTTSTADSLKRMKEYQQASAMALQLDADPTKVGLQLAIESADLDNKTINLGTSEDLEKELQKQKESGVVGTITKLITDLRENNIIEAVAGHTDVTYKDAAAMVNIYFKSGRPVQAMALMDKLIPDSVGVAETKQIMNLQLGLMGAKYTVSDREATRLGKFVTAIKASRETMVTQDVYTVNEFQARGAGSIKDLFNDFKTFFGKSSIGNIDQMGEEQIKNFIQIDTDDDTEDPMSLSTKNLFASYLAEWSPTSKVTSTERAVIRTSRNQKHTSLYGSGGDLMRIFAASLYEGTKNDKMLVWMGEKDGVDDKGNPIKVPIFETRTYDQIGQLTPDQVFNTLASSNKKGGLRWILGADLPYDMDTEKRNEIAIKRGGELYLGDDVGFWRTVSMSGDRTSNYSMQALKGSEGRLVQSMARHWISQYNDYLLLKQRQVEDDEQIMLIDSFDQIILAGQNNVAAILNPDIMTILENIKKSVALGNGDATAKDTGDGETIIVNNIFGKDSEEKVDLLLNPPGNVKVTDKSSDEFYTSEQESFAKSKGFKSAEGLAEILSILSKIQTDNPGQVVEGKFDWASALVNGIIGNKEYDMAKKVLPDLPDAKTIQVDSVLTNLNLEAVTVDTTTPPPVIPDSVDISLPVDAEQTALNNLEVSGVSNLMDLTNQQGVGVDYVQPAVAKAPSQQELQDLNIKDHTGAKINFENTSEFSDQVDGMINRYKVVQERLNILSSIEDKGGYLGMEEQKRKDQFLKEGTAILNGLKALRNNIAALGKTITGGKGYAGQSTQSLKLKMREVQDIIKALEENSPWYK